MQTTSELVCGNCQLVGPMGIMNQRVNAGNDEARGEVSGSYVDPPTLLGTMRTFTNHLSARRAPRRRHRSISSKHILPLALDSPGFHDFAQNRNSILPAGPPDRRIRWQNSKPELQALSKTGPRCKTHVPPGIAHDSPDSSETSDASNCGLISETKFPLV